MISRRGARIAYANLFASYRGPLSVIVQGMFVALIGLLLLVFNLHDYAPYQKLSGHVVHAYEETFEGQYDASWVQLDSSNNLFTFNKDDFQPAVDQPFFRGEKLDIYYTTDTPPHVAAIQSYDQFGNLATKFVTSAYAQNSDTYSTGIGPIPGIVVLLLGLLAMAFGAFKYKQARDRVREDEASSPPPASFARPALGSLSGQPTYAPLPPKYESPPKSLPPQEDGDSDYSFQEYRE